MSTNMIKNTALNVYNREYSEKRALKYSKDLLRARYQLATDLYRKDLYSHYGCVNAIEFSDSGQWLVSGGDDRRVLLWDVQKAISGSNQPNVMKGEHNSNIFCLGFDSQCHRLFSAGNDELVMIHDSQTGETVDVILHNDAIYGLSVDPINDNVFASACDDGRVCLWDIRGPTRDPFVLARYTTAFHAVMYNPFESRLVATANTKEGIAIWDVRKPRCVLQQYYSSMLSSQSAMSVRFNRTGTLILALRRRLPPVLYNLKSSYPIVEFDDSGYYNSCTMKSCSFGGDSDQYILSGSDDFKLYMWKIPDQIYDSGDYNKHESSIWVDKADLSLSGHRSIVNQVRYNHTNAIIASSGVEKVIKFWSCFPLPEGSGGLEVKSTYGRDNRKVFSHEDYINLVLESGQFVTHDYSHQSVQEDPRMMAFFDSLVQRDIEGWTSDSSDSIDGESSFYELLWNAPYHSDDSHSNSSAHNSDNEESNITLNDHYFSYLDVISKRIEMNDLNVKQERLVNQNEKPGTSSGSLSDSSIRLNSLVNQKDRNKDNGLNRISKLITEKKREQLKKIVKLTVRTTRKKLKKIQKRSNSKSNANSDGLDRGQTDKQLTDVEKKLDFLAQRVNCEPSSSDTKSEKHPRNHRRLRFLTNQSDLVFNDVLPIPSSSSSSDSEDFVSGEELYQAISNEVQRMRHILTNDSEPDSSDESNDSFELNEPSVSAKFKQSSSSDDDNDEVKGINSNTSNNNSEDKQKTNSKLSVLSNIMKNQYNDEDSDIDEESNHVMEPVIHCPYKHNLCHASTSTSTATNDMKKSSIVFKPIDTRKRSYRKRRRSGSVKDDKNNNKDNDKKTDKDNETNNKNHELNESNQ